MSDFRITTIIPTFRRPKLLKRAIKSVLSQDYPNIHVMILDNHSGDETAAVVRAIAIKDERVSYHCQPENIGGHRNFQYGLQHVSTPFFSFLSDDDLLLPNFYTEALQGFARHPKAFFSALGVVHISQSGNILGMPMEDRWKPGYYEPPEGLVAMVECGHPEWTGVLFRKEIVDRIGYLDESTGVAADLDFELRAAARCPYVVSLSPGAIFCSEPLTRNTSGTYPFSLTWPGWPNMIHKLAHNENIPVDIRLFVEKMLSDKLKDSLFSLGFRYLYQNKVQDARAVAYILITHYKLPLSFIVLRTSIFLHGIFGGRLSGLFLGLVRIFVKSLRKLRMRISRTPRLLQQDNISKFDEYRVLLEPDNCSPN